MAEYCFDCWNEMNGFQWKKENCVFSKELEICEGCGEWKHIVETPYRYDGYHPAFYIAIVIWDTVKHLIMILCDKLKR